MADKLLTLLEVTKRAGADAAVGLIEEVTTYAPEIDVVMGRVIKGISYKAKVRTALNTNEAFRNANEGIDIGSSTYEEKRFDCFFLDGEMLVDEAVAGASGLNDSLSEILADEASSTMRQKAIIVGKQFYDGVANDAKGFPGLKTFANSALTVDATGTGTSERVWAVRLGLQGVHFIFGNERGLDVGEWTRQQVADANNKKFFAFVNNLSGYIGLSCAHSQSVGYIKNLTSAKPMTDTLAAQLVAKFPVGMKPTMWFMGRNAAFLLQAARSAATITNRFNAPSTGADVLSPEPTALCGIPITITDSISTETAF